MRALPAPSNRSPGTVSCCCFSRDFCVFFFFGNEFLPLILSTEYIPMRRMRRCAGCFVVFLLCHLLFMWIGCHRGGGCGDDGSNHTLPFPPQKNNNPSSNTHKPNIPSSSHSQWAKETWAPESHPHLNSCQKTLFQPFRVGCRTTCQRASTTNETMYRMNGILAIPTI
jgi:hypothetical protein